MTSCQIHVTCLLLPADKTSRERSAWSLSLRQTTVQADELSSFLARRLFIARAPLWQARMSSQPPLSVHWGTAEGAEDISRYTLGGFHPVCLGDVYRSDTSTYRVLHKLGRGAFATVWLARTLHETATPS